MTNKFQSKNQIQNIFRENNVKVKNRNVKTGFVTFVKKIKMEGINNHCFVCNIEVDNENSKLNSEVNLSVCNNCKGSPAEKEKVLELLDSLADGLVCGCI